MTADHFCFYLQNRLIQTSQAGGQRYSDTSPFSIPWPILSNIFGVDLSTFCKLDRFMVVIFSFLQKWARLKRIE
jgi:hypothetical protein